MLNYLSIKLGFPVYVPSLIEVFISFFKYIFGVGAKAPLIVQEIQNHKKKFDS